MGDLNIIFHGRRLDTDSWSTSGRPTDSARQLPRVDVGGAVLDCHRGDGWDDRPARRVGVHRSDRIADPAAHRAAEPAFVAAVPRTDGVPVPQLRHLGRAVELRDDQQHTTRSPDPRVTSRAFGKRATRSADAETAVFARRWLRFDRAGSSSSATRFATRSSASGDARSGASAAVALERRVVRSHLIRIQLERAWCLDRGEVKTLFNRDARV